MKRKIFFISIFLLFLVILFLSPICGDDWGNYIVGSRGIYHSIGNAVGMYFDWEGRFISRLFINIFTYHKVLWNIVNSIAITGLVYYIIKLINPKNKKMIYLSSFLMILLMNTFTFSQVIPWIAGNITYLFVMPLLLIYYYYIFSNKKTNNYIKTLFVFFNLIMTMFIEHVGVLLVVSNLIFLVYKYIKNKKIDKEVLIYSITSIVGLVSMLASPGSMKRSGMENVEFSKLPLFGKITYNIPNFIYYTFIINSYLLILMIISNISIIKNKINSKWLKVLLILFVSIIPVLSMVNYLLVETKITTFNIFSDQNNIFIIIYYIILSAITLIMIMLEKNKKMIFFFVVGMSANGIMLMSPTWGYRTSFATYILLGLSYLLVIDKYIKENKIINYLLTGITVVASCCYIVLYISIAREYNDNLDRINNGIKNKDKVIKIVKYPYYVNCNINPDNDYHIMKFKEYYKINKDVQIKLIDNNWKLFIIYNK